ncbi:MAG: 50S ribosomal protein L18 [Candidatus Dasytiphilus stammeri]
MNKKIARIRRARCTRMKLKKLQIIRLLVHRTSRHIYAQILEDTREGCKVHVTASTLEPDIKNRKVIFTGNKEAARIVGTTIAHRALKKGIQVISFDRAGFLYHGRIKELAEAARRAGLKF